jgi:hypothetical protein
MGLLSHNLSAEHVHRHPPMDHVCLGAHMQHMEHRQRMHAAHMLCCWSAGGILESPALCIVIHMPHLSCVFGCYRNIVRCKAEA